MSEETATRKTGEARDLVGGGLVVLYWGVGLGTFLSVTDTWYDGVRFYSISPSIVSIAIIAVGVFCLFAAIAAPAQFKSAPRLFRRTALAAIALTLWVVLGAAYRSTTDFKRFSGQHEVARMYRADAGCSADLLAETGRHGPTAMVGPEASAGSKCQIGWSRVSEKTGAGSCLVLRGASMNGAFCAGTRGLPPCDWSEIKVGDAIAAQTFQARPAAFFCPTKDPVSLPFHGRGEVIQTRDNPVREFQLLFINRLLVLGLYLLAGMVIVFRVFQ